MKPRVPEKQNKLFHDRPASIWQFDAMSIYLSLNSDQILSISPVPKRWLLRPRAWVPVVLWEDGGGDRNALSQKLNPRQHRSLGTVKMGRVHPFVVNMTGYWHVGQNFKTTIDINDIYIYIYVDL